jgi:putative DNA primase/helicase
VKNDGDIGLEYNEEGKFQRVNVNKFLQAFIQRVDLRICDGQRGEDSRYYVYQEQGYWKEARPLEIKRMLKDLLDLYEPNRWNSTLMRHCLEILPVACRNSIDLTNSREYINVTNGLINLATLDLELHRKEIYSTTQLPVAYDEKAAYPNFLAFLQDAFMGDKEIPLLMQEIFGYALSPSLEAQKFFVWVGDGANAKSALAKILSELVGEQNISRVSLRKFGERFGLSSIVDKRLIISTENEMPSRGLDSEMLKAITVGDPVTIERKHADVFEYQPTLKMIFLLNRPPFFLDWSFALRRRMIIVPFEKRYIDGEPMTEFEGKGNKRVVEGLFDDLPGILAWSLEGWKRLRDNEFRFTQPKAIEEYLQEYWLEQNPFLDFVKSCVCRVPGGRLSTRDLCQAIYGFLLDNGLKTLALNLSNRKIIREIEAVLRNERIAFTRKKSHSDRPFYDVMLNLDGLKYLRGEGTCEYQR